MKMKKIITSIMTTALVSIFGVSAYADTNDYIEYCRTNYTEVIIDSADAQVAFSQIENLWNDRTVITEEEIADAEAYKNHYNTNKYYGLTMKVTKLKPFLKVSIHEPATGEEPEQTVEQIIPDSKIDEDASLKLLCTEENQSAHKEIKLADSNWYVVSIEKYDICDTNKSLVEAAMDSVKEYGVTFEIPLEYSETADLKMAKLDNGQVTYVEDIDQDESTYTITTTGSAAFVFVGEAKNKAGNPVINEGTPDLNTGIITDSDNQTPSDNTNVINNQTLSENQNKIDNVSENKTNDTGAPKTGDTENTMFFLLAMLFSCSLFAVSSRKCQQ